jgi:site-specific DNA-methyltransferase (adenine-specific)
MKEKITWHNEKRKISQLIEFDKNPRTLSNKEHKDLKKSLEKFSLAEIPAINQNNKILAGHQRLKILTELYGNDFEIDVRVPNRNLTEKEEKEYNIRSNKNTGEWDFDILSNEFELDNLLEWGFEHEDFGINQFLSGENENDEIVEPNKSEPPKTEIGRIYQLGKHRLLCGDSTKKEDVNKLMGTDNSILLVTDPPYGVNYGPEWRDRALGVAERSTGKVQNDDIANWTEAYRLFTGDICYVWHASTYSHIIIANLIECDFEIISQIIWKKQHFVLSRGDYHWQHEPCYYAVRKGKKHNWQGARDQTTVWEIKNNNSFGNTEKEETWGHGTQKPLECMVKPILNNTKEQDIVYDPFGGSGTTLIACEQTNRVCRMMEIDPKYCDAIVERYCKLKGIDSEKVFETGFCE